MTPLALTRLARIHGRGGASSPAKLNHDRRYLDAMAAVRAIGVNSGELPL
jgi:hypothetical protein